MIKQIEELTDQRLVIAAGTLYGIINSFLKYELIVLKEKSGTRSKKTYEITDKGRRLLEYEVHRLKMMSYHGQEVLR